MTNTTTNTIKIGKTTFTIMDGGVSPANYIDAQCYVEGPRGAIKNVIAFSNGCVRVVNYSRGAMPRGHRDIWGEEADVLRETLLSLV